MMKKRSFVALLLILCMLMTSGMAEGLRSLPEEKTITITIMEGVNQNKENNIIEQVIQEKLNIKLEYTYVPSSGFDEKLNTTLASGNLPDIVCFLWKNTVPSAWIDQGAVLRLDDPENNLLEKYGKNITRFFTDELMPHQYDAPGGIYSVKMYNQFPYHMSNLIRYDWLEKLGLEAPTTLDEFVEVMRAFKTQDPNGNGLQDEIPYMSPNANNELRSFFEAFGITADLKNFTLYEGKLIPMYEHPEFKNCVTLLRELYAEGLIDPEYAVRDNTTGSELLATDKVGIYYATGSSAAQTNALRENGVENAVLGQIDPIKGVGGQHIIGRAPYGTSMAITSTAKDPEACMMFMDYLFSDEGIELTNFGVEGTHHEKVDGQPKLIAPYVDWAAVRGEGIAKGTWAQVWVPENFLQITFAGKSIEELDEISNLTYHAYVDNDEFAYFELPGSIANTETHFKLGTDIWTPLKDEMNNYIMGLTDWASFESLLKELKEYGMDQITAEVNAAYELIK